MTDSITSLPAAEGALPVPVGDQPQPLDDTRLTEIAARVEKATPGPWSSHEDWPGRVFSDGNPNYLHIARTTGWNAGANEEFIAHAREDVPALLAEVQRQRDALDAHRLTVLDEALDALRKWADPNPKLQPGLDFAIGTLLAVREREPNPTTDRAEEA